MTALQTTCFWTDDYPRPPDIPIAPLLPTHADVAIIGSGYTGLHAALALAKHRAAVVVVDQHTIGWGASSRNGGMINTGLKESMPYLFRRYGAERGTRLWHWSQEAIAHVERTIRDENIDCAFSRPGQIVLAYKPSHFEALLHESEWMRSKLSYTEQWPIAPCELSSEIGSTSYHGGLLDQGAAAIHPARYVFGLARAAARRGVTLVENAEITSIRREGSALCLSSASGELRCDSLLLATNGYTNNIAPPARRGIFPIGSYIITTAPLPPSVQAEVSPKNRMFFDTKNFLNYFRLTPDGRMLFGGRQNLSPNLDLTTSARTLRRRLIEVFPQLAPYPITHSWSGKLGVTFDLMPHLARVPTGAAQGALYAYGYAGHGIAAASLLGREAGETLAGVPVASPIAEIRHRRYFFTPYDRLYLPFLSAYFRILDAVS